MSRAIIWYIMAVAWGVNAGISWHLHRNGHAALTVVIALIFAFVGWTVQRRDQRMRSRR